MKTNSHFFTKEEDTFGELVRTSYVDLCLNWLEKKKKSWYDLVRSATFFQLNNTNYKHRTSSKMTHESRPT